MHEPRLVILDEPTAGVDFELRLELWRYIRRLHDEGTTILLTTHYLEEAEELCEEIALIRGGRLHRPRSRRRACARPTTRTRSPTSTSRRWARRHRSLPARRVMDEETEVRRLIAGAIALAALGVPPRRTPRALPGRDPADHRRRRPRASARLRIAGVRLRIRLRAGPDRELADIVTTVRADRSRLIADTPDNRASDFFYQRIKDEKIVPGCSSAATRTARRRSSARRSRAWPRASTPSSRATASPTPPARASRTSRRSPRWTCGCASTSSACAPPRATSCTRSSTPRRPAPRPPRATGCRARPRSAASCAATRCSAPSTDQLGSNGRRRRLQGRAQRESPCCSATRTSRGRAGPLVPGPT